MPHMCPMESTRSGRAKAMDQSTIFFFSVSRALMRSSSSPARSFCGMLVVKPASWMAWRRVRCDTRAGSKTKRPLSAPRLTLASVTPSMRPVTRSMREEQAAQCIPPIFSSSTLCSAGAATENPSSRTCSRILSRGASCGSKPRSISWVARLTATFSTPGMAPTTFSMRAEQAAQCIPPTGKRSERDFESMLYPAIYFSCFEPFCTF
jgi:hypothetical protein